MVAFTLVAGRETLHASPFASLSTIYVLEGGMRLVLLVGPEPFLRAWRG